jgi:hypothetical protein
MTEAQWLAAEDPGAMLEAVRRRASPRKLRLFQVACVRRVWQYVTDPGSRALVELVERAADEPVPDAEFLALPYDWLTDDCGGPGPAERHAYMVAGHVGYSLINPLHYGSGFPSDDWQDARSAAEGAATVVAEAADLPRDDEHLPAYQALQASEGAAQAGLLRCLFGNPFRPVGFDPRWRTADTLGLARGIYEDRAFDRLPVLADALLDAGCADEEILGHCRSPGPHARGCWVVDLVLGKEQSGPR